MLKVSRPALAAGILCLVAALPFAPRAREFAARGVPDVLFSGDAAALELRVLHAGRSVQLLGPYSQHGWSHPGPAYFYLALPVYKAFGERGAALNVFAFLINLAAAIAIALTARRLRGNLFALVVSALVAVYGLVGVPVLLTNEWNPILPILPLALLCFVVARLALGAPWLWPVFAFLASAIVQTHVGYGAAVAALLGVVLVATRVRPKAVAARVRLKADAVPRAAIVATAAVLAVCWALPLYEAATEQPGNLQQLIAFFAPGNLGHQSWGGAAAAVADQLAVFPLALLRTIRIEIEATRGLVVGLALVQAAVLAVLLVVSRRRDPTAAMLSTIALVLMATSVFAVRAIRGDIAFYLVAWISAISVVAWAALAAWTIPPFERALDPRNARALVAFATVGLIALAMSEAGPPRVYGERDVTVEALATAVEKYLRAAPGDTPVARIETHETWPAAVAVILHLYKRGIPVAVEDKWVPVVGRQFAATAGDHPRLLFGDGALYERARAQSRLRFVGDLGWVYVYFEPGD